MSNRKLKINWFSIPDWKREEVWLNKQHLKGWKFVSFVPPCFYKFEKCEPENVVYQLDYNQEGLKEKTDYIQIFEDCGWEYITDSVGYSYFRKSASQMNGPEEIFCDDQSRMDMIRRVFKGKMIPLLALFLCIIVPQLCINYHRAIYGEEIVWLFFAFGGLLAIYLIIFINFAIAYWKINRNMKQ